jgi:hypothetical protein
MVEEIWVKIYRVIIELKRSENKIKLTIYFCKLYFSNCAKLDLVSKGGKAIGEKIKRPKIRRRNAP